MDRKLTIEDMKMLMCQLADKDEELRLLRNLCNDLFNHICAEQIGARVNMAQFVELSERMCDLGLLEDCYD